MNFAGGGLTEILGRFQLLAPPLADDVSVTCPPYQLSMARDITTSVKRRSGERCTDGEMSLMSRRSFLELDDQ